MTVKFRDPVSAQACIIVCTFPPFLPFLLPHIRHVHQKMNGRYFDGHQVEARLYDGRERYQRTGTGNAEDDDDDEAEKKRLDAFASWLESDQ